MALLFDQGPEMSDEEFLLFRARVRRHCGLSYESSSKFIMERRLRPRLDALNLSDYQSYYRLLQGPRGPAEIEKAVDALVTNETYFFREEYQLRAFEDEILPKIEQRNRESRRLSIWSAGCSTGEEVYSLAMIVAASQLFAGWDVRIFGSDISRRVLRRARTGVYGEASFRAMQDRFAHFFRVAPNGRREVLPEIKSMCHFGRVNLARPDESAIVGSVDAIFCRNVLIYFNDDTRAHVVRTLYDRLVPGGHLMLGHSESLFRGVTDFELVHLSSDLVYKRPES